PPRQAFEALPSRSMVPCCLMPLHANWVFPTHKNLGEHFQSSRQWRQRRGLGNDSDAPVIRAALAGSAGAAGAGCGKILNALMQETFGENGHTGRIVLPSRRPNLTLNETNGHQSSTSWSRSRFLQTATPLESRKWDGFSYSLSGPELRKFGTKYLSLCRGYNVEYPTTR
ncbi:hypothetical protein C8F04DRAFT_1142581, partial [Mycena alexandri]